VVQVVQDQEVVQVVQDQEEDKIMPKLQTYREAHYTNTGKVSDNVRTLSISAIGIVWIFKTQNASGGYVIPGQLYYPILLVFAAMSLDFIQYLYGSIAWYMFFRLKEKAGIQEEVEILAPPAINCPSYIFFFGKVSTVGAAYFFIIKFLLSLVTWTQH
jgi:hypothetical protein